MANKTNKSTENQNPDVSALSADTPDVAAASARAIPADNIIMWHQGVEPLRIPKCDGLPASTVPASKTISAEYMRGYYNLTTVLNPTTSYDPYGYDSNVMHQFLSETKQGDILWLLLVPPHHYVEDIYAYNGLTLDPNCSYASFKGFVVQLVHAEVTVGENNEVNLGAVTTGTTVTFTDKGIQFGLNQINTFTWAKYRAVGLKLVTIPAGKTLADIQGVLRIGAHVRSYETQQYM